MAKAQYKLTPVFDEAAFEEIQDAADVAKVVFGGQIVGAEDSSETLVFARQLETIKNVVYEKKYAELKGRQFVPVSYEGGPDSEYITFRVWDGVTMAKVIADYATDYETVTASAFEVTMKYFDIGNSYMYSIRDMRRAARANVALDSQYAMLARRGIELGIDDVVAVGVPSLRTFGLTNNPNVSILSLTNGNWSNATGEQILADLNQIVTNMWNATLEIWKLDTILMSTNAYRLISTKLLNSANASNVTVLEAFQRQNPGITVESWTKLALANASGNNGRIVAYRKSDEVLQFEMGKDFEVLAAVQEGLMLKHFCQATCAGVAIRHPLAVTYCDNQNL